MLKKKIYLDIFAVALGLLLFSLATTVSGQWTVKVDGAIDSPYSFTLDELKSMPQTQVEAVLLCDGAYVTSGVWTGVQLGYLLELAGVQEGVKAVFFSASDGFQSNLPIEASLNDEIIIAHQLDKKPLQETLRLVVPEANGEFWISDITSITVSRDPYIPPQRDMNPPPPELPPPELPSTNDPPEVPTMPKPPTTKDNETNVQPTDAFSDTPPLPQSEVSSRYTVPPQWGYPIVFAAAVSVALATGYVTYDRKQRAKEETGAEVAMDGNRDADN